jgi:ribosomal protein S18 acetylase RimI-like enzyme
MEPQLRIANDTDVNTILPFMRQFYAIDQYPFDELIARTTLTDMAHDSSLGHVWLIYNRDKAVGYLVITFGYSLEYHGRDAFIDELFIEASYRHQGIGTKVMEFALEACRELGVHALHLEVERTNIGGQALYRKFGFEDTDRYLLTRRLEE